MFAAYVHREVNLICYPIPQFCQPIYPLNPCTSSIPFLSMLFWKRAREAIPPAYSESGTYPSLAWERSIGEQDQRLIAEPRKGRQHSSKRGAHCRATRRFEIYQLWGNLGKKFQHRLRRRHIQGSEHHGERKVLMLADHNVYALLILTSCILLKF